MKKEQVIRPTDAKEYIRFQFEGLATTLDQFDYRGMAQVVRAACMVFDKSTPDCHETVAPDCILLNTDKKI